MAKKFKSKKAWEAEADKLIASGKSPQEVNKLLGPYSGPEGNFTIQQSAKTKRGIVIVDKDKRRARGARRTNALKEQDQKLLDTLEKAGYTPEEALEVLDKEHASYKRVEDLAKKLNETYGKGAFNAGHETAALEGGINSGRNARVEIGKSRVKADGTVMRGNQSRGRIDEAPDDIKPVMGIPRSGRGGEDVALQTLLEEEFPDLMDTGLTPKDRQEIKRNPGQADEIFQNRQNLLDKIAGTTRAGRALRMGAVATLPGAVTLPASAAAYQQAESDVQQDPSLRNRAVQVATGAQVVGDSLDTTGAALTASGIGAPVGLPMMAVGGGISNTGAVAEQIITAPEAYQRSTAQVAERTGKTEEEVQSDPLGYGSMFDSLVDKGRSAFDWAQSQLLKRNAEEEEVTLTGNINLNQF
jgi:hypothetical protein